MQLSVRLFTFTGVQTASLWIFLIVAGPHALSRSPSERNGSVINPSNALDVLLGLKGRRDPTSDVQSQPELQNDTTSRYNNSTRGRLGSLTIGRNKENHVRINPERLFRKLEGNFDPGVMSVTEPQGQRSRDNILVLSPSTQASLRREMSSLNITAAISNVALTEDQRSNLTESLSVYLYNWLVDKMACQVLYSWEDLGEEYFPRWIRQGYCDNNRRCSLSNDMRCVQTGVQTVRLLRWTCLSQRTSQNKQGLRHRIRHRRDRNLLNRMRDNTRTSDTENKIRKQRKSKYRCRWKKFRYHVTTKCSCSC